MKLVQKFRSRQQDMKTLSSVIESSLVRAANHGDSMAGAHHLAASALEMDDGTAAAALATFDKSPADFIDAVAALDADILAELAIESPANDSTPSQTSPTPRSRLGKTDATYEAAIRATYSVHNEPDDQLPLVSAHVLAGVATVTHGVSARAFAAMGVEREALIDACRSEIN